VPRSQMLALRLWWRTQTRQAAYLQERFRILRPPATKLASTGFSPEQWAKHRLISPLDPVPDTISVSAQR